MAKCKGCGQTIMFISMKSGKPIPVNPTPVFIEDKNGDKIIVTKDGRIANGRQEIVTSQNQFLTRGYISHFATCPYAAYYLNRNGGNGNKR